MSEKPPVKDYLREMKSKREQQQQYENRSHMLHGAEIDKVLRSREMSEAEKYNLLRIKTE